MALAVLFRKNKMKKAPLPKVSLFVQIGVGDKHLYALMTPYKSV